MSNLHHLPHLIKETMNEIDKNKKPGEDKSPFVAAVLGFLFGPIGIGLYFQSWKDFFLCLVALILLTIILVGFGVLPGWLFSAGYGFYRASN